MPRARTRFALVALLTIGLAALPATAYSQAGETSLLQLDQIISEVKRQLKAAQGVVIGEPRFALKKVTVALKVSTVRTQGGQLEVGVPAWGLGAEGAASIKREQINTVTVELSPPEPEMLMEDEELTELDIASIIVDVHRQLAAGLLEEPRLTPTKMNIEIKFGARRTANLEGTVDLVFISLGGEGEFEDGTSNTLKLEFVKPLEP